MEMFRWQLELALWRQRGIAQENAQREMRWVDGLGQHKISIDPFLQGVMRRRYGEECWKDPDFVSDCLKKTPELRAPRPAQRFIPIDGFRARSGAGNGARANPATVVVCSDASQGIPSAHEIPASVHREEAA
jgi:hypothetical protein